MEGVVPCQALIDLIEPHYPMASKNGGRLPYPVATMLRIHLQQKWYSLTDPAMEEALIVALVSRRFAVNELISARNPDETTIFPPASCWSSMGWVSSFLRPSRSTSVREA
jgi:IS5 family transposase